jgi:hypothetical protein
MKHGGRMGRIISKTTLAVVVLMSAIGISARCSIKDLTDRFSKIDLNDYALFIKPEEISVLGISSKLTRISREGITALSESLAAWRMEYYNESPKHLGAEEKKQTLDADSELRNGANYFSIYAHMYIIPSWADMPVLRLMMLLFSAEMDVRFYPFARMMDISDFSIDHFRSFEYYITLEKLPSFLVDINWEEVEARRQSRGRCFREVLWIHHYLFPDHPLLVDLEKQISDEFGDDLKTFNGKLQASSLRNIVSHATEGALDIFDVWGRPYRFKIIDQNLPSEKTRQKYMPRILLWSCGENGIDEKGQGDDVGY